MLMYQKILQNILKHWTQLYLLELDILSIVKIVLKNNPNYLRGII